MCLDKLLLMFKPKPVELVLPHPEELPDYGKTLENVSISGTLEQWFQEWGVPPEHWNFWKTRIVIEVTNAISSPAQTWEQDGIRHLQVRPEWLNPGVIAHEFGHCSFTLLSDIDKQFFGVVFMSLVTTDPLVKLAWPEGKERRWLDTGDTRPIEEIICVEGHGEVARYLGQFMPEVLKQYYPRLF